jgi:glycine/D-amino acid oxidase-like deaminating enzyme
MGPTTVQNFEVTVIGGGLAGMAASLHLAKAGFRVVCIEPETGVRQPVGESLDWASPALLDAVDLPWEDLIHSGIATYKRGVTMQLSEGEAKDFRPPSWVAQSVCDRFKILLRDIGDFECVPKWSMAIHPYRPAFPRLRVNTVGHDLFGGTGPFIEFFIAPLLIGLIEI